ncbi:MAG: hypothetical protein MI892_25295 [Desulfobacterales bacterium]|nr:hypothetical protein [Desulfobacterales bacterium]
MKKPAVTVSLLLLIALFSFFLVDSARVRNHKDPLFAIQVARFKDGGSRLRIGFLYYVINWKRLSSRETDGLVEDGFEVGVEFHTFFDGQHKLFPLHELEPQEPLQFLADSSPIP